MTPHLSIRIHISQCGTSVPITFSSIEDATKWVIEEKDFLTEKVEIRFTPDFREAIEKWIEILRTTSFSKRPSIYLEELRNSEVDKKAT